MEAVVLAAGRGTRMGPLTDTRPKPLLPVGDRPLLAHVLDACHPHVEGFVIVVGYRGDQLRAAIGDEYRDRPVTYVTQDQRHGTAHAIAQARPHVEGPFVAVNGDVLVTAPLLASLAAATGPAMAVQPVDDPGEYGVVDTDGAAATAIVEKPEDPPTDLANLGCYRFTPAIFDAIDDVEASARGEYEITDAIATAIQDRGVTAVEYDGPWIDVGRPWDLLTATETVLADQQRSIDGTVEAGATLRGPVRVETGARVRDGAYLEGPVLVRAGADVGPNAYLRPGTVLGPDVRVGHAVEIKNSLLMADTSVGHLSYVGDSILGAAVNFGAGTTVANLRHDDETVHMQVKGESVDTGRRKLGVVVGDRTKTGIDTSLNAGVTLGTDTRTRPGEVLTRDKGRRDSD